MGNRQSALKMWAEMPEWMKARRARKLSIATKKQMARQWADPVWREKMLLARKAQANTPKELRRRRFSAKKSWAKKSYRDKQLRTRNRVMYSNPIWREKVGRVHLGKPSWNAGFTKETNKSLARMSKRTIGTIPNWGRYAAWYDGKYGKIKMRSSWEVKFALWLDAQKIAWKYEPKWFNVGKGRWKGVSYTPDFYLPKTKQWVEVKGYLNKAGRAKIAAFRKKFPKLNWVMYRFKELKAMGVLKRESIPAQVYTN